MELYQIRYALAVGRLRSFTRAAEEIPVTVASVSEAVRDLEAELGVRLFERTTRRVWPTRAGEVFLDHASRLVVQLETLRQEIEACRRIQVAVVRLGTPPTAVVHKLPEFLAALGRDCPALDVRLTEADSKQLMSSLRAHEVDICFLTSPPGPLPEYLEAREAGRQEVGIALAQGHPQASQDCIELSSLADLPMVVSHPGPAIREIALEVCRRAGVQPRIALETSGTEMLVGLVRAGVGFTFLTRPRARAAGLAFVRCVPAPQDRILHIAWLRDRSLNPEAQLLLERLCNEETWLEA